MAGRVDISSAGARYAGTFVMEVGKQPHRKEFQRKTELQDSMCALGAGQRI